MTAIAPADIPLSLYVHLPWCVRKCPYCDFNSHEAASGEPPFEHYVDALLDDLAGEIGQRDGRPIATIFLGGGTPSLFPGKQIARLLDGIRRSVDLDHDVEITLEANPGAADAARFSAYRDAGVNRLSIGVQSFRDEQLRRLGRVHDGDAARAAIEAARKAGFDNINIDLMHGLPGDTAASELVDLRSAIAFKPAHISWYQLTIEPGTKFARKPPRLPQHDAIARESERGRQLLAAHGFEQYEVSAYAHPTARAKHNLNYWEFGDYIGIGAGAHGKLSTKAGVFRTEKRRSPRTYVSMAREAACTTRKGPLQKDDLTAEFAMNVLRLRDGFNASLFSARTGLPRSTISKQLQLALERGWITEEGERIYPTELGYRFLNDLQLLFIP